MIGRGIDQILPYSCKPEIHEPYVKNAREYVRMAEIKNGEIPEKVNFEYIWGDSLEIIEREKFDLNLVNLETALTESEIFWRNKEIHYRCNPKNIEVLKAFRINCCNIANNHILDWDYKGLSDTLNSLRNSGIEFTGAGKNLEECYEPAKIYLKDGRKIIVLGVGSISSGIPKEWGATDEKPGVLLLESLKNPVSVISKIIRRNKEEGDLAILSIHWGENWGFQIHNWQKRFAKKLIKESGVDVIHGHSSHHFKGFEIFNEKLILYGCGDFINDYEGIPPFSNFRDDLTFLYNAKIDNDGNISELQLIPFKIERMRLRKVNEEEFKIMHEILIEEERKFNLNVEEREGIFYIKI